MLTIEMVQAGDSAWPRKPLMEGYHVVWCDLHEELIALAEHTRRAAAPNSGPSKGAS